MHLNVLTFLYLVLVVSTVASPLPQPGSQQSSPAVTEPANVRPSLGRLFSHDSLKSSKSSKSSKSESKTQVIARSVDLLGKEEASDDITKPAKEAVLKLLEHAAVRREWQSVVPFEVHEWINHPALHKDGYIHFTGMLILSLTDPEDTSTRELKFSGRLRVSYFQVSVGLGEKSYKANFKEGLDGEIYYVEAEGKQRLLVRVIDSKIVKDIEVTKGRYGTLESDGGINIKRWVKNDLTEESERHCLIDPLRRFGFSYKLRAYILVVRFALGFYAEYHHLRMRLGVGSALLLKGPKTPHLIVFSSSGSRNPGQQNFETVLSYAQGGVLVYYAGS
ncbi:hypothetical protein EV360DRAFT_70972 [Lentinula raphanica]|nr:hypothetical protein EV360DRAFT_70972 [Lentinula raphanica]